MKKIAIAILAFAVSIVTACSKGSFENDARAMYNDFISITEKAAADLDKAASAKEAGDALGTYADQMKLFVERGKELEKNYDKKKINEEPSLTQETERFNKAMQSFANANMKVMIKWQGSPEIMEATAKLRSIGGAKAE